MDVLMKDKLFIIILFALAVFLAPLSVNGARIRAADAFPESIRLLRISTGEIQTLSAEEYIVGCLAAQIPIDYEQEALNAQAAASATYALRLMSDRTAELPDGADISDSTAQCQPYLSPSESAEMYGAAYDRYSENLHKAARYGITHIIKYEGEPIYAVYHSVSAGRTCSAFPVWSREIPYLRPAESACDTEYINFECSNEITAEAARLALVGYKSDIETPADCSKWFSEMNADEYGYVTSVKIGSNIFSGGDIWRIFGLRSTAFSVTYSDGIFTFVTKGYGHGAGLSQYGAQDMAKKGKTAEEILKHYYGEKIEIAKNG